ncbi:MAG TPA: metal-dependent hydrolase [Pirellulaceae bacterium]|nr:metal-dependent hydrolase [Pirellulaceae bacterium]
MSTTHGTTLTWLGHACWQLKTGGVSILLDPFLTGNPAAPVSASDVAADYILISHGHGDHVGDAAAIANRTGATVISSYEITEWLRTNHGVKHVIGGNLGGGVNLPFGRVKLTLAHHSSMLPDGTYGGNPCGFLVTLADKKIYFACDTGLFLDMQLIGRAGIDVAVLPIGDLFTMGPDDALEAVKLIGPRRVVPSHFNTWPPIAQDANAWAARVKAETSAEPTVLAPGGSLTF